MKYNKLIAIVAFACLAVPDMRAQVQGVAMSFIETDRNPVTSAMAGASVLRSYEATDVLLSYCSWDKSSTQYFNALANVVAGEKLLVRANGTYGIGSPYEVTSGISSSSVSFSPSEMSFGASAMYRVIPALSVEAGVKYASTKLSPDASYNAFAADVLLRGYFSGFSAAAGVINIGSKAGGYSIPSAAVLAVAYDNGPGSKHRIRPEVDAKYYFAGVFGVSAGIDYTLKDMISVRAGYHFGGVVANHASVGLGFKIKGIHLDASYLFNNTFCAGLGYSF